MSNAPLLQFSVSRPFPDRRAVHALSRFGKFGKTVERSASRTGLIWVEKKRSDGGTFFGNNTCAAHLFLEHFYHVIVKSLL
jgi:hypothetical protein